MNFENLTLVWLTILFLMAGAVILGCGVRITDVADRIADRTGLGEALIGGLLLGEAEKTQVTKKMLSAMVGTLALAGATLAADATIADVEQRSGDDTHREDGQRGDRDDDVHAANLMDE